MVSGFVRLVLFLNLFSASAAAQDILEKSTDMKANSSDDSALISGCYEEMYRCMRAKDTALLGKLLDGNFVLVHMTGMRQPKAEYLHSIADGRLNYFSCNDTRLEISVRGDTARMTGRSRVNAAVFGGGRHIWSLQLDIDLVKRNGTWLMTEARAATY